MRTWVSHGPPPIGDAPVPSIESDEAFRRAAGQLTGGVTVLTTAVAGRFYGTTVAAVIPLSDEPAMILASMNRSSATRDAVVGRGAFAVNVLAEEQAWIARQFAGKQDKFAGVAHRVCEITGAPLIEGALASLSCELSSSSPAGSHTALFGTVRAVTEIPGTPLTYFGGSFGRWERLREHDTYEKVRLLVLQRDVPVGQALDITELAARFDARPDDVHNALVKLSMEQLVTRGTDGRFEPAPIGPDLIESLYDARANIEIGVVANHVGRIPDSTIDGLGRLVRRMGVLRRTPNADAAEFFSLHSRYHLALVSLSGSNQLMDSYRRLHIAWVWRSVWQEMDWQSALGQEQLEQLTDALAAADLEGAIRALQDYHREAKELARIVVDRRGGAL